MAADPPFPNSYWVEPSRLLVGEYPSHPNEKLARERVRGLVEAGVETVLDLTEAGERDLKPYGHLLIEEAATEGRTIGRLHLPIRDFGVPTTRLMRRALRLIAREIAHGRLIYLHCFGGIGRTGTVVGCYLREKGLTGPQAIAEIKRLRRATRDSEVRAPETTEQRAFVRDWKPRR